MKTGILLALCALAFASQSERFVPESRWFEGIVSERNIEDREFRQGRHYRFAYDSQISTGIPGSSKQHAATRIQAVVSLVFKNPEQARMQLTHIRMAKLNRDIPSTQKLVPFEACEEVEINEEEMNKLRLPVQFKYNKGMIVDMDVSGGEKAWSLNIKRGVLNQLQVNLQKHRQTKMAEEARLREETPQPEPAKRQDHFTVMEETLEGDCETMYTVTEEPRDGSVDRSRQDQPQMRVVKSINFEKCNKRPEIRYNFRFGRPCPSCQQKYTDAEKFLESSTVTRFEIVGTPENFIIEQAKTESQYTYAPFNQDSNLIQTVVKQELKLLHTEAANGQNEIETPKNKIRSEDQMIYSPDWDILKEEFFMKGEDQFHEETPYSAIRNKVQFTTKTLKALVNQMRGTVKEGAPRHFARLVKILRMCRARELNNIHEKLYKKTPKDFTKEEHKQVKDLLVDALALAGTKDTIDHLVERIEQRQISPLKGAFAIKTLINTRVVSQQMIQKLLQLAKSQIAERNPALKQSCMLTVGSMINALCVPNKDKLAKEFRLQTRNELPERMCPKELKERYVQELFEFFKQAPNAYEKILALKTISNAAIDLSIFKLEKIIKNQGKNAPYSPVIRSSAIEALRLLTKQMPRKVQRMLMPIYMQKNEKPEMRVFAFYHLMQTLPEKAILDQIARKTIREKSRHVASFVITYLQSMANSTNPCEKNMADDLKLSLRHARQMPISRTMPFSKYIRTEYQSKKYHTGVTLIGAALKSQRSYLPQSACVGVNLNIMGSWQKHMLAIGGMQMNTEEALWKLVGAQGRVWESESWQEVFNSRRNSPRTSTPRQQLKQLFEKLDIQPRSYSESEMSNPFALLYLRWKDQEFGLLPLSTEHLPESINKFLDGRMDMPEVRRFLNSGYHFDVNTGSFISEFSKKIPTSIGMPLCVETKAPTVVSIRGQVRAEIEEGSNKGKLIVKAQPSMVTRLVTKVEAWSPIVNSGLKLIGEMRVHTPIDAEIEIDADKTPAEFKLRMQAPEEKIRLLTVQTRPVTITRVWPKLVQRWEEPEERTVYGKEWNRVYSYDKTIGENALGLTFNARGQWHQTPSMKLPGTPNAVFAGPNKMVITCQPGNDAPKEIVVIATGRLREQLSTVQKSSLGSLYEKVAGKFFGSEERRERPQNDDEDRWQEDDRSNEQMADNSEEIEQRYASSYETRNPLKSFLKVVIKTRGSRVERKCEIETELKCGQDYKHCLYKMELIRSPVPQMGGKGKGKGRSQRPWKMLVKAETLYPQSPYSLSEVADKKVAGRVEATWGTVGNERRQKRINIRLEGEQSRQQQQLRSQNRYQQLYDDEDVRRQHPDVFSPVAQYEQLIKASRLTQFKIFADYKIPCETTKNVLNYMYRAVKHQVYPNTWVEMTDDNPKGQMRVKVTVDPKSFQLVNITAKTPQENVYVRDLPLKMPLTMCNIKRQRSFAYEVMPTLTGRQHSEYETMARCKVQSNRVKTFDGVNLRLPITTCYSVLAKDCSTRQEQPRFAVLMKKMQTGQPEKKIKIMTEDNVITIEPKENNKEQQLVKVNGQEIDLEEQKVVREHGHVILRVFREGPYCKVVLPEAGVKVYFDGYTASIKISDEYKNIQCGLCGHYDDEQEDEERLPNNQISSNHEEFHRSYLHQDNECQIEEDLLKERRQYNFKPYEWEQEEDEEQQQYSNRGSSSSSSSEEEQEAREGGEEEEEEMSESEQRLRPSSYRRRQQPQLRTKVIENGHELCFSKQALKRCPRDTFAVEMTKQKKVVYTCMPRSDPDAEQMLRRVRRQENLSSEVKDLPASFTQAELVPQLCRPF